MTAEQFTSWRTVLRLSQAEAAHLLGVSVATVKNYERERSEIPQSVALATCSVAQLMARGAQRFADAWLKSVGATLDQ